MLPDVGSTIVPPGLQQPVALGGVDHRDRDAVLHAAARVHGLDLGEQRAAQALGLAQMRRSRTSGVLPTRSRIESAKSIGVATSVGGHGSTVAAYAASRPRRSARGSRRGRRRGRARSSRRAPRSHVARDRRPASRPCSTAAACTHAPAATCSVASGTTTGRPREVGERPAGTRPSARRRRRARCRPSVSTPARVERVEAVEQPAHDAFERGARRVCSRVVVRCAARRSCPVASGRFGVRSPSKYGHDDDAARAGRRGERERVEPARGRRRASRAIASVTFVALSVHTSGRKRPVASAKPATAPVASAVGVSLTAKTVPDVPSEIATSPGASPSAERGGHVVAGAGRDDRVGRTRGRARGSVGRARAAAAATSRRRRRRSRADRGGTRRSPAEK